MRKYSRFGWMELILGILLVLLGGFTLFRPESTLTGLVVIYGAIAVVTGVCDIVFYVRVEHRMGIGPLVSLVSGVLSVMSGVMLLGYPDAGKWILSLLFPLWFISHCVSRLSHLNIIRITAGKILYYFSMIINIIGIILGFLMIFHPTVALLSAGIIIGVYLVLLGIDSITTAFARR